MVSINWCLKVGKGLELVSPNKNMSDSYIKMAEESLNVIKRIGKNSNLWLASTSYYTLYYCLYSLMIKIGIKCEIHKCSIEFMKRFLLGFYDSSDAELINTIFNLRNDLQYYPDKLVDKESLNNIEKSVVDFLIKTKEILLKISEKEVNLIRENLEEEINNLKEKERK